MTLPQILRHMVAMLALGLAFAAVAGSSELAELPMPVPDDLVEGAEAIVPDAIQRFEKVRPKLEGVALGQAYGRLGLVFHAWGAEESARVAYENAAALDPGQADWPYYLGLILERAGRLDEAVAMYRKSMSLDENYPNTLLRIGQVSLRQGDLRQAQTAFDLVLERYPDLSAPALAGLGTAAFQAGDFERAADLMQRAVSLQPAATRLHDRIAEAYRQLGDQERARFHASQAGGGVVGGPDVRVEMMKARVHDSSFYVALGNEAVKQGEMDRAVQTFMLALSIDPEDTNALTRLALALGFGAQREETTGLIEQALTLDPGHGLANSLKGAMLAEAGNYEEAQQHYYRAVSAEPENVDYRMQFANGLMRLGDYDSAARQYAEAAGLAPDNPRVRYGRAVALSSLGDCEAAMREAETALALNPRLALSLNARARLYATCPAATADQRRQALEDALHLYQERPDQVHSETVAMAMAANGRFEEAMDYQGQAIFEALKAGDSASQPALRENMQRYEAMMAADAAWPVAAAR